MGFQGFVLDDLYPSTIPNECGPLEDYGIKMQMLLDRQKNNFEPWKKIWERCSFRVSNLHRLMLETPIRGVKAAIESYLKHVAVQLTWTKEEYEQTLDIYHTIQKQRADENILEHFFLYLQAGKGPNSPQTFKKNQHMLILAKKAHSSFLGHLIELHVALNINNRGWAKKIISRIVQLGPEELIFRIQPYVYRNKAQVKRMETVAHNLLISTKALLKNKLLYGLFENKIKQILKPSAKRTWSLADIRERIKGHTSQGLYFDVWIKELLSRTSHSEVARFLEKKLDKTYIHEMDQSKIWIFHYYYPKNQELRGLIIDKIYQAYGSQDPYLEYLVLKLLNNPIIKKSMAHKDPFFKKALFQIKRNFYRRLLYQGRAVHFSLYNLMELEDKAPMNLWWSVF